MKKGKKAKAEIAESGENVEKKGGKKGGKKKLLLIPVFLVLVAAVAAAVVLFVLPRFGINLLGGDSGDSSSIEEPLPKKGIETYTVGEDSTISLDTVLEEGEGELIALRSPGKSKGDSSTGIDNRYTYIYEMSNFAEVMNRYLDILLGSEQNFSITDETYLIQEERPELQDAEGVLILARPATEEGHVFQLVIGWSQASDNLAVRVSSPEGTITKPEPKKEPEPTSVSEQMEQIRNMLPAQLGLSGSSMDDYTIFPVDGFVKVNDQECRRFNLYERGSSGGIAGTYLLSVDGNHMYVLDPVTNTVSTIR